MKTLPSGMQADLDAGTTTLCTCWKLVRTDATVMGFTDHDIDVVFGGVTYKAATGMNASTIKQSADLAVGDLETIGALDSSSITELDIGKKLYDNAEVTVYRVDWTNTTKRATMFVGYLGTISRGRNNFKAEVRSIADALSQPQGKLYQSRCRAVLGSTECGVNLASDPNYIKTGTVATVYSRRLFALATAGIISRPTEWFSNGLLEWTSGANTGFKSEVKSHLLQTGGGEAWIDLWEAMPYDIAVTDGFTLTTGCNKIITTCKNKFNNVLNFRGFPRMPVQDTAIAYASKKDINDGTSWYVN